MSLSKVDKDVLVRPKVVKEYIHHDFTVFNAYIDGLVDKEAASVKHNLYLDKANRLKIFIFILIATLILTICVFFWILSSKTIALIPAVNTDLNVSARSERDAARTVAQIILKAKPTVGVGPGSQDETVKVDIIRDFTIFETVIPDLAELRNIKSVITGFKYSQSDDERPTHQYCYAHTTKSIGNSNLRVDVANFLKGKLQPIIIDEKSLSEFNITRITFEQLVDYCQFDRL